METRDAGKLQASFSVIEADTGRILAQGLQATENWWVGLEAVYRQVLLLHGYADRQTGQHMGLQAFDAQSGRLRWKEERLSFYGLGREFVVGQVASGEKGPRFVALDYEQGLVLNPQLTLSEAQEEVTAISQELTEQFEVPVRYQPGTDYFNLLQDFVSARRGVMPVKAIDYLETKKYILVGYYTLLSSGNMATFLAIFNLEGDLLREERLMGEVAEAGAEAFFIFRKKIFVIQDGKSLLSLVI